MAEDKIGWIKGVPSFFKLKLKKRTKHVEAKSERLRDAGSIPATSTKVSRTLLGSFPFSNTGFKRFLGSFLTKLILIFSQ